jgi:membrane-bound lytic murein transglycosylase D
LEEIDFVVRSELPLEVNDRIDRWVERYLDADRATFEMFLERQGLYATMIREMLHDRGMPAELLYIPMIESAFTPDAVSEVSASGMWQFMEATARSYGLVVNETIDERRDPVRATEAALDYLEELHGIFGSWPLAVAAYNAGPETIRRALERSGGEGGLWKEDLFWKIRDELPLKNREYLPKLLAVAFISQNFEHFGFREVQPLRPYEFEGVLVPGGTTLAAVAKSLDLPLQTLRDLNPHLLLDAAPAGESHLLRVPPGEAREVAMARTPERTSLRGD